MEGLLTDAYGADRSGHTASASDEASKLIVNRLVEPIVKELLMEYAVKMNRLIELQIESSSGKRDYPPEPHFLAARRERATRLSQTLGLMQKQRPSRLLSREAEATHARTTHPLRNATSRAGYRRHSSRLPGRCSVRLQVGLSPPALAEIPSVASTRAAVP